MKRIAAIALVLLSVAGIGVSAENWIAEKVKEALPGKTKLEVKEMFGPPQFVQSFEGDDTGQWTYGNNPNFGGGRSIVVLKGRIIYDEVTDKAATGLEVQFKNGGVTRVKLSF